MKNKFGYEKNFVVSLYCKIFNNNKTIEMMLTKSKNIKNYDQSLNWVGE